MKAQGNVPSWYWIMAQMRIKFTVQEGNPLTLCCFLSKLQWKAVKIQAVRDIIC